MPTLQYDGLITIATGSSRRSASWKTKEMLWSEFVDKLGRVTRTQETQQEYFRMPKEERDNAKDVGGFVGGTLKGGRRKIDAVLQRRLITLDMDSITAGEDPWPNIIAFLTENADMVSAVLVGLATTVGILAVAWVVHAAAQWLAVAANQALIVSLLSNPILWIALIIGVLVAAMYRWIQSIGGVKNAWEICKLALIVGWNAVKLAFFTGVYWVIDLVDKLKLCWQKAGVAIANFMGDMKVSVLTILQNMINGAIDIINKFIGVLNKIPGVSIDAIEHVTFATTAAAENEAAKSARAADLAAYESELASAKAGRDAHIDSLKAELNSSVDALQAAYAQAKADAAADSSAEQTALDGIGADTAGINDSTGSAAASLKETTEDLKYMRDLAEQEAINRFTTAEVKIDMTGMTNRIDSDMDLDGVLNTLTEGFAEALEVAAEGVHE